MNAPELSLVVCTLDEADSIGGVLAEAAAALEGVAYEIIVVDDSADDRTARAVEAFAADDARVRLIRREGARGLASAAIAGWDAARGELLAIMDGDGQHDAALLRTMRDRLAGGSADFAVASRYVRDRSTGLTGFRDRLSRAGTALVHRALGVNTTDPLAGFFVFRRDWYQHVRPRLSGVGFKILIDVMASSRRRPRVVEVPTALRARTGGVSKLDARVIVELAAQIVEKRSRGLLPARFVMFGSVGASGVVVHLSVLALLKSSAALPFWSAQAGAVLVAMTSNFFLNNALTFRDLRLHGAGLWRGLLAFYVACAGGAVLNEAAAAGLHHAGVHWLAAGFTGCLLAAVWNYWSSAKAAWGPAAASAARTKAGRPKLAARAA